MTELAEFFIRVTACLKTSRPDIEKVARCSPTFLAVVGQAEPPPGILRIPVCLPSVPMSVAMMWSMQTLKSSKMTKIESTSAIVELMAKSLVAVL